VAAVKAAGLVETLQSPDRVWYENSTNGIRQQPSGFRKKECRNVVIAYRAIRPRKEAYLS
jgi:hypothetical protein